MNGKVIPESVIVEMLTMADWAPTHGRTEPWRFIVVAPEKVKEFVARHAAVYQENTDPTAFAAEKFNKIIANGENVSHIIMVWMKRSPTHKVPEVEEVAAVSAAIQNILLTATAQGIASFWSSGGMIYHAAMKKEFNLGDEDKILGMLFLGYANEPFKEGFRATPLSEKTEWLR